jgi:hypothetical protein
MMAIDYVQVGQPLRARRVGSGNGAMLVAVDLYQKFAKQMWNRAAKGVRAPRCFESA